MAHATDRALPLREPPYPAALLPALLARTTKFSRKCLYFPTIGSVRTTLTPEDWQATLDTLPRRGIRALSTPAVASAKRSWASAKALALVFIRGGGRKNDRLRGRFQSLLWRAAQDAASVAESPAAHRTALEAA